VLSDLYLGDPGRALTAFEQYRQLTGEDKPVSGWIAELRQRLGMPPVKRPAPADGNPGDAVPGAPPAGTPGAAAPPGAPASPPRAAPEPQSQAAPGDSLASAAAGGSAFRAGG